MRSQTERTETRCRCVGGGGARSGVGGRGADDARQHGLAGGGAGGRGNALQGWKRWWWDGTCEKGEG